MVKKKTDMDRLMEARGERGRSEKDLFLLKLDNGKLRLMPMINENRIFPKPESLGLNKSKKKFR